MAEEGILGLARAYDTGDTGGDEPSKAELQSRMEESRDSISQTVTEIKDNVVHQYEAVKDTISETLDWREQFKKQPLAWSLGAVGAGFLVGYGISAVIKGPSNGRNGYDGDEHYAYQPSAPQVYEARPINNAAAATVAAGRNETLEEESAPGLLERLQETAVYDRLSTEASAVGNRFVDELSKTAQEVLLPAAIGMIQRWLEGIIPKSSSSSPKV